MSPLGDQFVEHNRQKNCIRGFRQPMSGALLLVPLLLVSLAGCAGSNSKSKSNSEQASVSATTSLTQGSDLLNPPLSAQGGSPSRGSETGSPKNPSQVPTSQDTVIGPSLSEGSPSQNGAPPMTTLGPSNTVPSTAPRFTPFQCVVQIRETSQKPSPNTEAIRVDVAITGQSISTVFLEAVSGNQRDRKAAAVSKSNTVTTQMVVLAGQNATVTVYAAPDFEPDARMCSAKR